MEVKNRDELEREIQQLEDEQDKRRKLQIERKETEDNLDIIYRNMGGFLEDMRCKYRGTSLECLIQKELENVEQLQQMNRKGREIMDEEYAEIQKKTQAQMDQLYEDIGDLEDDE